MNNPSLHHNQKRKSRFNLFFFAPVLLSLIYGVFLGVSDQIYPNFLKTYQIETKFITDFVIDKAIFFDDVHQKLVNNGYRDRVLFVRHAYGISYLFTIFTLCWMVFFSAKNIKEIKNRNNESLLKIFATSVGFFIIGFVVYYMSYVEITFEAVEIDHRSNNLHVNPFDLAYVYAGNLLSPFFIWGSLSGLFLAFKELMNNDIK
ncbi:MAG: hypothetical protein AAF821_18200 [Cyanobacteria bacterium P01_D01_bin.156]